MRFRSQNCFSEMETGINDDWFFFVPIFPLPFFPWYAYY